MVLEKNLDEVEKKIRELVAGHELTPYLMSLPGVGPNLVATFLGYLGTGERFSPTNTNYGATARDAGSLWVASPSLQFIH